MGTDIKKRQAEKIYSVELNLSFVELVLRALLRSKKTVPRRLFSRTV